jgi:Ca2+:H+ antiporter
LAARAWTVGAPLVACFIFALLWGRSLGWMLLAVAAISLVAAVVAAVHHAEVIALRVGEPFGTLVLALAVTIIEVSLIVSLMLSGGTATTALARDTVFATVMIVCNGVVGLCLLLGALRHRTLAFRVEGVSPSLSVLATLAILTLVVPTYTSSTAGPTFTTAQLVFAGVVSLTLYGMFVFVQTVRHRDYFLPVGAETNEAPAAPPSTSVALMSLGLLSFSLPSLCVCRWNWACRPRRPRCWR